MIPKNAKMVFKGKIFEVWQWEQQMFDGSTEIFERLKRPNTAEIITLVGDKIMIQEQEQPGKPPFTSLPGGRCDKGENPLSAAKRELLEETGYTSSDWELLLEQNPVGKIEWTVYTYIARNCKKVQSPSLDSGERIETKLINFDEFLALADDPTFRSAELICTLLRAQANTKLKEKLRKNLFK